MSKEKEEHLRHPSELWEEASYDVECLEQEIINFQYRYDYNRYTRLLRWAEMAMVSVSMTDTAQVKQAWQHVNNLNGFLYELHCDEFSRCEEEAEAKGVDTLTNGVPRSELATCANDLHKHCDKILNVLQTAIDKAEKPEGVGAPTPSPMKPVDDAVLEFISGHKT